MTAGLLVRLRPSGPWRFGATEGVPPLVDTTYHSDSLYAAVCGAMDALGQLSPWLAATAAAPEPAVRFTSCFPWQDGTLYFPAPRSNASPVSARLRLKDARFMPSAAAVRLLAGRPLSERDWAIDGASGCLVSTRQDTAPNPFRVSVRSFAAVDRVVNGHILPHRVACIEFASGAGLWTFLSFADDAARERWRDPLTAAFRLLADSGFGGRRSIGWGRASQPEFEDTTLAALLPAAPAEEKPAEPAPAAVEEEGLFEASEPEPPVEPAETPAEPVPAPVPAVESNAYWLLSLFCPGGAEAVDWASGSYSLIFRAGRVESQGAPKKTLRMVAEGSVLMAATSPHGAAPSVAPDGFPYPVYRYGFPVSVRIGEEAAS